MMGIGTGTPTKATATLQIDVRDTNAPPMVEAIDNKVVNAGQALDFTVKATDADGTIPTLAVKGLPAFASFKDNGNGTATIHAAPTLTHRGNFAVTVFATDDGNGDPAAVITSSVDFILTARLENAKPRMAFVGNRLAVIDEELVFQVRVSDLDEDPLTFTATGLPAGATFTATGIYGLAEFKWKPGAGDAVIETVTLTVTDSGNGKPGNVLSDSQTFQLVVRATNQAPILDPVGSQELAEGQAFSLTLSASDADNDTITFRTDGLPSGAQLDPMTGVFAWTPDSAQAGTYRIRFEASDGNAVSAETVTLSVANVNTAPRFVPLPGLLTQEGSMLSFNLVAVDFDGDTLTYSVDGQLPTGAQFDAENQLFVWNVGYDQAGQRVFQFTVSDAGGLTATTQVLVHVINLNRAPVLPKLSGRVLLIGEPFTFTVPGSDPDSGAKLTYTAVNLPTGATFNTATGEVTWTPTSVQAGEHNIRFTVSDGDLSASQTLLLVVSPVVIPPSVRIEMTPSFPVAAGQPVMIQAVASSITDMASLTLTIDGQTQTLDRFGRVQFTPATPGHHAVVATAVDQDGAQGVATADLKVRDPADRVAPRITLETPQEGAVIAAVLDVKGMIEDSNLDAFVLDLAPLGTEEYEVLATAQAPAGGTLAILDPARLLNGAYTLRLTATDISGRTSGVVRTIEINSGAKTQSYEKAATDFTVTLAGLALPFTRYYSSLNSNLRGAFGFGWMLGGADPHITTNLPVSDQPGVDRFSPYHEGTRLYLTLPDNRRVGFSFTPQAMVIQGITVYRPAWTADQGVSHQLASADALLEMVNGGLYELGTGLPYNPASGLFSGFDFTLTTPNGLRYDYDLEDGLRQIRGPAGQRLLWTDSGLIASDGQRVSFLHDASDRLTSLTSPAGQFRYQYDSRGALQSVIQTGSGQREFYNYDAAGRLAILVAPAGQPTSLVQYESDGRYLATATADLVLGGTRQFLGTLSSGTVAAGEMQHTVFLLTDSETRTSQKGAVTFGIDVRGTGGFNPGAVVVPGAVATQSRIEAGRSLTFVTLQGGGPYVAELRGTDGTTSGGFTMEIYLAGDGDGNLAVDGNDSALLAGTMGSTSGQPAYLLGADANRDGTVTAADQEFVVSNFGFVANQPPTGGAVSIRTHLDLPVTVSLEGLASDPEGKLTFLILEGVNHGTVTLGADGRSAMFVPTPGYAGPASFTLIADDGYLRGAPATVTVDISDAPLVAINLVPRSPLLDAGDMMEVVVLGDFTDQSSVPLPAEYVQFATGNSGVATVTASGQLRAVANGATYLRVWRGDLQAVTAVAVGRPEDLGALANLLFGMTVYPEDISLTPGTSRQLTVTALSGADLTALSTGTVYFSSNPQVATVSETGLVRASAVGEASISILNNGAELVVDVRVNTAQTGTVKVDEEGGVVQGSDGSQVLIAPNTFEQEQDVSLTPIQTSALPFQVTDPFEPVTAFELTLGNDELGQPVQLAVPVGSSIPVGQKVYFFRAGTLPDAQGNPIPAWYQVEAGVVGPDGIARTASPPFPGVYGSGTYCVVNVDPKSVGQVRAHLVPTFPTDGVVMVASQMSMGVAYAAVASLAAELTLMLTVGPQPLRITAIPEIGLPTVTDTQVQVDPDQTTDFFTPVFKDPSVAVAPNAPVMDELRVRFTTAGAELVIKGKRLVESGRPSLTHVSFDMPGLEPILADVDPASSETEVIVEVPQSVVLGLTQISVIREGTKVGRRGGTFGSVPAEFESAKATLGKDAAYVFAALVQKDEVAVMSQVPATTSGAPGSDLVARIPVPLEDYQTRPRAVAVTPDLTRAYVTLIGAHGVALLDAQALQVVDADPFTPETIDYIVLPDYATPLYADIDPEGKYLYVTDNNLPYVYIINVQPGSASFNQLVETMVAPSSDVQQGFRGLAVNADGKRLYVAAPKGLMFSSDRTLGQILVFNVDEDDKPDIGVPNAKHYRDVLGTIPAGYEPWGVSATSDPLKIVVANRAWDASGVQFIAADKEQKSWTVVSMPLQLLADPSQPALSHRDYFDVNNAIHVVVLPDLSYAFVAAYNRAIQGIPDHDPNMDPRYPAGGNVGIIADPFGPAPKLVAATRPTPDAFLDNLALSSDSQMLFAGYRGSRAVFVFDVEEIIKTINQTSPEQLLAKPVNDLNPAIEIRANYRVIPGGYMGASFGTPEGATNGPIGTGGQPSGLAAQESVLLELVSPSQGEEVDDRTPELVWRVSGATDVTSWVYVSTFPMGEGLFPDDRVPLIDSDHLFTDSNGAEDMNPARIVNGVELTHNTFTYTLPDNRELTAGQTYYWGVAVEAGNGRYARKWGTFTTAPVKPTYPFSSVTILTHGFTLDFSIGNDAMPQLDKIGYLVELGRQIAKQGGDGVVLGYNRTDGTWQDLDTGALGAAAVQAGKPLVLISEWVKESDITDSGFAEAAADALFAALVRFDKDLGGRLFASPLHFIGHSRGTVVNSEILQRLGYYKSKGDPNFAALDRSRIQMTTLDAHDAEQESLNVTVLKDFFDRIDMLSNLLILFPEPTGITKVVGIIGKIANVLDIAEKALGLTLKEMRFGDFIDPDVKVWDIVGFADDYYQQTASEDQWTFTPNGWPVDGAKASPTATEDPAGADLIVEFSNESNPMTGFTQDDLKLVPDWGLGVTGFINNLTSWIPGASKISNAFGFGLVHSRPWKWYAGTTNLSLTQFTEKAYLPLGLPEPIFRRFADPFVAVASVAEWILSGVASVAASAKFTFPAGPIFDQLRAAADDPKLKQEALLALEALLKALPLYFPFEDFNRDGPEYNPWYTPATETYGASPEGSVWEGIGVGWYFSELGGGSDDRPIGSVARVPSDTDNSDDSREGRNEVPVPTVFNGNFEWGTRQQLIFVATENPGRFPLSYELPGWSFHGGSGYTIPFLPDGSNDITGKFIVNLDFWDNVKTIAGSVLDMAVGWAFDKLLGKVITDKDDAIWAGKTEEFQELIKSLGLDPAYEKVKEYFESIDPFKTQPDHALMIGLNDAIAELLPSWIKLLPGGQKMVNELQEAFRKNVFDATTLVHNRQYIPYKDHVKFYIWAPLVYSPNTSVSVSILLDGETTPVQLGTVQIEEILLFTGREYSVPVPDSVKGKTGRLMLTFNNLSDEIRLEEFFDPITGHFQKLNQLLFIDNIRFADGGLDVKLPKETYEGDEVTMDLTVTIDPEDTEQPDTVVINWGDPNSDRDRFEFGVGSAGLSRDLKYTYLDDGKAPGNYRPSDVHVVTATLLKGSKEITQETYYITVKNRSPVIESLDITPASIDENDTVTLTCRFLDYGVLDNHLAFISWGDNTFSVQRLPSDDPTDPPVHKQFTTTHQYLDDGPWPGNNTKSDEHSIQIVVLDDDFAGGLLTSYLSLAVSVESIFNVLDFWTKVNPVILKPFFDALASVSGESGIAIRNTSVLVKNVAPEIEDLKLSEASIEENDEVTLTGGIKDPGTKDEFTVTVDWGPEKKEYSFKAGSKQFEATYRYLDDGKSPGDGMPVNDYDIKVTLKDDDVGEDTETIRLRVENVDPEIAPIELPSEIDENETVILHVSFKDQGTKDWHPVTVFWGDGEDETVYLPPATLEHQFEHTYLDDGPWPGDGTPSNTYTVTVTVRDDDTGEDKVTTDIIVHNVDPVINSISITPPEIDENGTATLVVTLSDPGTKDEHPITIDWGDSAGGVETFRLGAGVSSFTRSHQYLDDDPTGTPWDSYLIQVRVEDDDSGSADDEVELLVVNVDPIVVLDGGGTIVENQTATIKGTIVDPGTLDSFQVSVDWGPGQGSPDIIDLPPGTTRFAVSHQYLDDGPSPGNRTPEDTYDVRVTVIDDDTGSGDATTQVVVRNERPQIQRVWITQQLTSNGIRVDLHATYFDPGTKDVMEAEVVWEPGASERWGISDGALSRSHEFTKPLAESYSITLYVRDDDTGEDTYVFTFLPDNQPPELTVACPPKVIQEGNQATVSGSVSDPNVNDTHTVFVDWKEGPGEIIPLGAGATTFQAVHLYADDNPTGTPRDDYFVEISVTDNHGAQASLVCPVTVENRPPSVALHIKPLATPGADLKAAILENQKVTLDVTVIDFGIPDVIRLLIEWGDGKTDVRTLPSASGTHRAVTVDHLYEDDGPSPGDGKPVNQYQVTVTAIDDDDATRPGVAMAEVQVTNVLPQIESLFVEDSIFEGETVTLSGVFFDPGFRDVWTLLVDWGRDERILNVPIAPVPLGGDRYQFTGVTHTYLDDGESPGNGTPQDDYRIAVQVLDDDVGAPGVPGALTGTATLWVKNVAPTVVLTGPQEPVAPGDPCEFTTYVDDPGMLDQIVSNVIDWGDGTSLSNPGVRITHTYNEPGIYEVTRYARDDDQGDGFATWQVLVRLPGQPEGEPLYDVTYNADTADFYVATPSEIWRVPLNLTARRQLLPLPGGVSLETGLQRVPVEFTLGNKTVPAGSLLVFNGNLSPDRVYALDPVTGNVLATLDLAQDYQAVAGGFHAGTGNLFVLGSAQDRIYELQPSNGSEVRSFSLPFGVASGGLAIHPNTGNLFVGSSLSAKIVELRSDGVQLNEYNLRPIGIGQEITGLSFSSDIELAITSLNRGLFVIHVPGLPSGALPVKGLAAPTPIEPAPAATPAVGLLSTADRPSASLSSIQASPAAVPDPVVNGRFAVSDSSDAAFGWRVRGDVAVAGGKAILRENDAVSSRLSQVFEAPGQGVLRFSLSAALLNADPNNPPDALEVALRDAITGENLGGSIIGLAGTDAYFNLQSSRHVYFSKVTTVASVSVSGHTLALGPPELIGLDLSDIPAGVLLELDFDLLGFGIANSSVTIGDVSVGPAIAGLPEPPVARGVEPSPPTVPIGRGMDFAGWNPVPTARGIDAYTGLVQPPVARGVDLDAIWTPVVGGLEQPLPLVTERESASENFERDVADLRLALDGLSFRSAAAIFARFSTSVRSSAPDPLFTTWNWSSWESHASLSDWRQGYGSSSTRYDGEGFPILQTL
ncbi:MAG: putative Ig domain-containing protein [Verrucomicrobiia bacterium]